MIDVFIVRYGIDVHIGGKVIGLVRRGPTLFLLLPFGLQLADNSAYTSLLGALCFLNSECFVLLIFLAKDYDWLSLSSYFYIIIQ